MHELASYGGRQRRVQNVGISIVLNSMAFYGACGYLLRATDVHAREWLAEATTRDPRIMSHNDLSLPLFFHHHHPVILGKILAETRTEVWVIVLVARAYKNPQRDVNLAIPNQPKQGIVNGLPTKIQRIRRVEYYLPNLLGGDR